MTKQQDGTVLYAVYGTLRKNKGNDHYLKGAEYLGTLKTPPNFKMLSAGGFPIVTTGDKSITVEIYKTDDPNIISRVNRLEGYTGTRGHMNNWYDTCDIHTEYGVANMFIQEDVNPDHYYEVESGDWANR